MDSVIETWTVANEKISARRGVLQSSLQYHQFVHNIKEVHNWLQDLDKKINSQVVANSAVEADALIETHQVRGLTSNLIIT